MAVRDDDNTVAIAVGASIGGLVLLIALAALMIWFVRRRRNAADNADAGVAMQRTDQSEADSAMQEANSEANSSRNDVPPLSAAGVYHDVDSVRSGGASSNHYAPAPQFSPSDRYVRAPLRPAAFGDEA